MGEAMLRMQPIDAGGGPTTTTRHLAQPFLRSLGGDELNVAVALSLIGVATRWISVLPEGPMGDLVAESCAHHGVELAGPRLEGDLGFFTVLPEEKMVHYQRRNSVFAKHDPAILDWPSMLGGSQPWLHMTGITPLISEAARESWANALAHAAHVSMPTSLDLNHRKQLGTLEELWTLVRPHTPRLELLILSAEQLNGLAAIELGDEAAPPLGPTDDDAAFRDRMALLHGRWGCRRVALCRKVRDARGVQRRWSIMTVADAEAGGAADGVAFYSTYELPVWHAPREDIGVRRVPSAAHAHGLHRRSRGWSPGVREGRGRRLASRAQACKRARTADADAHAHAHAHALVPCDAA